MRVESGGRDRPHLSEPLNRRWLKSARSKQLWRDVTLENSSRVTLKQLTQFVNSPWSTSVVSLRLEGFVVRAPQNGSQSSVSNHLLNLMGRKMTDLKTLRLNNANILNISIKTMPKSIEHLSLEGCIVDSEAFSSISSPGVLPNLRHLDLNYVHNLDSYSQSFAAILKKKKLESLQLRHCYKVANRHFKEIGTNLTNLRVLNLSEIATVDDSVMESLAVHINLVELYVAFTIITDKGINDLCENKKSQLRLLDIRGCPKATGHSLLTLNEKLRLKEVWISRKMKGASEVREMLTNSGEMRILDEVDLKKTAIAQDLNKYSAHFGSSLESREEEEMDPVEDPNFAIPQNPNYFQQ